MRKQYHIGDGAITINVIDESVDGGDYGPDISVVAYDDRGAIRYGVDMDHEFTPCDSLKTARAIARQYADINE